MPAVARYIDISERLQAEAHRLPPNSLLPTEQQLVKRFRVSRGTVRRALGLLERSGLVSRQRGRGTTVNPPKITRHLAPVYTFEEDLRRQHIKFETRVLQYTPGFAPPHAIRDSLRLPPGVTVNFLSLLRLVEDRVICHDRRYFPISLGEDFDPLLLQDHSSSDILRERAGLPITAVHWETEIIPSPRDVAMALGITPGVLVVANTGTAYLENGSPIETAEMYYRIDRVKFKFTGRYEPN